MPFLEKEPMAPGLWMTNSDKTKRPFRADTRNVRSGPARRGLLLFQSCHRHLPQLLQPLQMSLLPQQNRHMLNRSGGFVISVKIEDLETFQKKLNSNCLRKDEIIE